jgi:ComF family protein
MTLRVVDVGGLMLDMLYPRWCEGCGNAMIGSDPGHICWDCSRAFRLIRHPYCDQCGDPSDGELSGTYTCSLCRQNPPSFDKARSAVRYRGAVKSVIQAYKYRQAIHLTQDLASLLEAGFRASVSLDCIDAVVAVPLHSTRQRERTFNQSDLLAGWLANKLGRQFGRDCLRRVRATDSQTTFNANDRRHNVSDAFDVVRSEWVEGRRILLIDDVMTTGATLHECSRVLKNAGAVTVIALTVARG